MGARAQTAIYACISQWGQIKFKISLELNDNYNFTIFLTLIGTKPKYEKKKLSEYLVIWK